MLVLSRNFTKVYPIGNVLGSGNELIATQIFDIPVRAGFRPLLNTLRHCMQARITMTDDTTQMTDANATYPTINWPSALFTNVQHYINGQQFQDVHYPAQQDTIVKRSTKSKSYLETVCAAGGWIVSLTGRLNAVSSDTPEAWSYYEAIIEWLPHCLSITAADQQLPPNISHRLEFIPYTEVVYTKRMFQSAIGAAEKVITTNYNLNIYDVYLKVQYEEIKYEIPPEVTVKVPFYWTSHQPLAATTTNNLTFNIPRNAYKIFIGFQAATVGTTTLYSATEMLPVQAEHNKFTNVNITFNGVQYPTQGYRFVITRESVMRNVDQYGDYLAVSTDGLAALEGAESLQDYMQLGELYALETKPIESSGTLSVEVTSSSAITTATVNCFVCAFIKKQISAVYREGMLDIKWD
jgi:hypothetical protein